MKNNLSSTGILKDISSMRQFAIKLLGRGKDYDELLSVIIKKDYYYDDDLRILKIKDLQLALNKSYSVISRQLQEIYKDLQEHYKLGIEFTIKKVEYIFYMYYFDRYSWFILDELPFMPRIGECIEIPFLREKVGCSIYYIESIYHELTDSKQSVNIHLNPSSPNLYFRLRKDEAYLKHEISSDEYYSKKDWEIKEKLKLRKF